MKRIANNYSSKNDINITQIAAYKDNKLMLEENRYGFKREDTMNVMSVTKSITSLLVGIAFDRGYIKSLDDHVMDYFKDSYIPKKGEKTIYEVTIRHLLTMTAPYKGKSEPWKKVCTSSDWTLAILDSLGGRAGITGEFSYRTLGCQILLGIVKEATKMNVLEFANKYLFEPLGIEKRKDAMCRTKEDQLNYVMNKKPHGKVWFLDPQDMPTAGWGLSMSAYELAQIGLLVLNKGVFNGKRVISEKWLNLATKSYVSLGEKFGNQDYGFLWWLPHRDENVVAAIGDGGNVIYINKEQNIVVGVTGYFKPLVFDRIKYIEENVVSSLLEGE